MADLGTLPDSPRDLGWSLRVAIHAMDFFAMKGTFDPKCVGKSASEGGLSPLMVSNFLDHLSSLHGETVWDDTRHVIRLIGKMATEGWLEYQGNPINTPLMGNAYWASGFHATTAQSTGVLYLSSLLGPELIIRSYGPSAIPITGKNKLGDVAVGTGFALDERHILTNAHVVEGMDLDEEFETSAVPHLGWSDRVVELSGRGSVKPWHVRVVDVRASDDGEAPDVAVIEIEPGPEGHGLIAPHGAVFRDPEWADRVLTFGYPPVPTSKTAALVVHHGEVVNPAVPTFHGPAFLYSAVTRPGNSGGPIVASDGRIVGIVAHDVRDEGRTDEAPYYRAIPANVVLGELKNLGLGHLATVEDWKY